ncbi:MAG: hypothetical protein WD875_06760 [Pirellulales bacterium]
MKIACVRKRVVLLAVAAALINCAASVASAAEWQRVSDELLAQEKPGYGGLTGIAVHPNSGDVYAFLSEKGLYRSSDLGATWTRHGEEIKGRTEWPGAISLFPGEKADRFVIAMVYGGPIVRSEDGGKTFATMDEASKHVDWCAVAPDDPKTRFVLTLKHESGDVLIRSNDGGRSFVEIGKDFGPACVFDERTAVVQRGPLGKRKAVRTTDGGATFEPCADWNTRAMPQWRDGVVYWLVDGAIVSTSDKGATWKRLCDIKDGRFGPVFGKNASHLLVLTTRGIVESRDGGASWSEPTALPKGVQSNSPLTWIAYDAGRDVVYLAQMGAPMFRLKRGE